jgi:inorganic pyrophosphatase/exopolyphosphatase
VDSMIILHTLSLASITDTQADTNMVAVCADLHR